jgi:hypothetical protein
VNNDSTAPVESTRLDLLRYKNNGPVPYVERYLADEGISILPDCSFTRNGVHVPVSDVMLYLTMQHFVDIQAAGSKVKGFPDKILQGGLDIVVTEARQRHLQATVSQLSYDPAIGSILVQTFVKAMTGEERPLDVAVLQHWIRNVRRRMSGKPVAYHIFPIFFGRQGGGKSEGLKRLLSPLQWYVMEVSAVPHLTDERNFRSFSEKYVAVLDEMARSDKTDQQLLKGMISAETMSARVLGTNRRDRFIANCSYVGTSNVALQSLVPDSTGMRRFYELRCADLCDWATVNSIDYATLWRSVDPDGEYLAPFRDRLKDHQEELRQPSITEQFVQDMGMYPGAVEEKTHRKTNAVIYANYRDWAEQTGRRNLADQYQLLRELKQLAFPPWRGRDEGSSKAVRGYAIAIQQPEEADPQWRSHLGEKAPRWNDNPSVKMII